MRQPLLGGDGEPSSYWAFANRNNGLGLPSGDDDDVCLILQGGYCSYGEIPCRMKCLRMQVRVCVGAEGVGLSPE